MRSFFHSLSLFLLMFILTGCFGSNSSESLNEVDSSGLIKHTGVGYVLRVPASWEKVDSTTIVAPVAGKIELAMRSLVNKRGFMNNLIILSETLTTEATASEYVSQSMLWASREYLSLAVETDEQFTFGDGETSRLVTFRAKYNEVTEEHLFMQTARICDKKVYLITLGLENDTPAESYDRYRPIFSSFECQ